MVSIESPILNTIPVTMIMCGPGTAVSQYLSVARTVDSFNVSTFNAECKPNVNKQIKVVKCEYNGDTTAIDNVCLCTIYNILNV